MALPEGVKGFECKHAIYSESSKGTKNDMLLVKRNIHKDDGTVEPDVKLIYNYEREFYILNDAHRNYNEKKCWEDIHKCRKFKTNQARLTEKVAQALNRTGKGIRQSILFRSPYIYGADITTSALIKRQYMDAFPECSVKSTVGVMDVETDTLNGTEQIITGSFTYQGNIYLAYTKDFVGSLEDVTRQLQEKYEYYIGGVADDVLKMMDELDTSTESGEKRYKVLEQAWKLLDKWSKVEIHTQEVDNAYQVAKYMLDAAHKHRPDFVAFWNMPFDIEKMIVAHERVGADLAMSFSDPEVPMEFKAFKWTKGQAIKTTATGKTMSKHPAELWHKVETPASFFMVDAMCVFKQVRVTEGNRNSYSLDAILRDELNLSKLRFAEADHLSNLDWHQFMQKNHKIEYMIYNIFDCMSIEILDNKTTDLSLTVPTLCGQSDYAKFPSTPRRLCDDMHFYLQQYKKVIAVTSDDMTEDLDQFVVNMNNWIVTLPCHMVDDNGLAIIKENDKIRTSIRAHVADLDVASSYPNTESFMNISQETTMREMVGVQGVSENDRRKAGLNLTAARTNAVECAGTFFDFPTLHQIHQQYKADKAAGKLPQAEKEASYA